MAVVNTKSTEVTNLDAEPAKVNDNVLSGGRIRKKVATVAVAAGDTNASVLRFFRVHSSWSIHSIIRFCDALTLGSDYDLGLYDTAEDGGGVVNVNAYADALTMVTAIVVGDEVAFEARDIANIENKVWQDAGASEDPDKFYDLCLTAVTIGTAAGDISLALSYTDGS